jgi:hypothetical protein
LDKRANSTAVYFIGDPAGFSVSGVGQRRIAPTGGNTSYNLPGGVTIVEALAFNRTNNNLAFLGSSNIYRSNDVLNNTPTWTQISNFSTPIMHVHSCIANPNRLYVVTNDQKIYVSNDALSANPTFAMYNLPAASNNTATVTAISNNADIVYIAINNRVYRSADGGQNWANITYNLPSANHRQILAEEYDGTEELVLVATNNAVYYKKAGQVTWTNYSTNLPSRKSPTDFSMYDDGSNQAVIRYASYGRSIWETPFHNIRATRAVVAAATTNACSDATWKFADASTGNIVSRVWSFTSGTPSNSTDAHPTVTYATTGTYNVTLTVTDALGNTASTMYQAIVNDLNKCDADTIPGNALSQSATTDYLLMNAPLNISTNTITFSAWVKPNGVQSSTTGLIMSGSNGATGIHLRNSNRLSYHWNNESGSYNFSGPTIPSDVWSHIAVVVTPSSATFYLNGVPTVRNASHVAVNFNSAFYIGNDRGNISRTFKGLMDEVCIYNRSLTTNEIREMMHLTKNPTADPNLLAYYQMNEPSGNLILNHAQTIHAALQGNATRNTSTAPVGGGLSERQGVASSGAKNFSTVGVILTFPNIGTLPNGDVVVTRLNVPPDQKPTPTIVPQNGYYIINNFGTNSTFETLTSIQFDNLPNIGSGYSTGQFGFYKRSSVADGNTWGSVADRADTFVPNGQNSSLTFSTGNNINSFSQFALTPTYATAGNDAWLCSGESVGIGDVPISGLTYSWSPAVGLSATNISNPTASPTTTTTYTLTVTETASGMTFTDDVVVSIHSVPLLSAASITPTPASATVCGGGSVLMTASGGSAAAFVELGNGASVTTGNSTGSELGPNPLQNYYGGSKQQMLFTAAELHALGITTGAQLSGFGVNLSTAGTSYALNNLKISIQHTSLAALSTFVMSGWTTVRNAANYTPAAGWNTIPFNTNFTWDGLSNLLVEITYSNNNGGSGGTLNTAFFGTTNFVSTLFYRNDSQTAATIEAYSGAPSYSYSLRNNVRFALSGTTNYTWSPIAGLNASTGSNVTATPSTTTTYTVSATFSGACPATASQAVTVNANPSLSLAASCSGGPGTGVLTPTFVAGSGGTASYNPSTLTGLSNGNYTVTVTESPSGCTATASATINCTVQCPDLSAAAPAATVGSQSTCSNCNLSGGILAAPSGTCPTGSTLQYSTDGGTSWTATLPTYNQTTAMTILTRCNCNSDTNQSSPTASVTTVPGVCTPVTATISGTATACDMVQLTASGGASYVWNGGASPSTAINTFSASGTYTVTVTGSNGCTASASQVVTVNANPSLSLAASCSGGPGTGVLTPTFVAGSGGTASYNPSTLTGLSNGNYTVTVTESPSGCTATASATINCTVQCPDLSAAAPAATVSSQSTCSNCALSGGTLAAPSGTCPTGSTLQYSTDGGTSWTATLPTYNQTTAMTILTRCNCNSDTNQSSPTASVTTVPGVCTPVTATISGTATACDMVQLTASGGASYVWNGGASPSTAINTFSASGTYTVTVTGSNGCTASASQVVTVNANPSLSLAASCSGGPGTGVLTPTFVAGSGGTASYNPSTLTGLSNGNYTVTVTESPSGCTATASATINCTVQCPDLSAAAPAATVSSQSTCSNCNLSGGILAAPSGTCPTGSTLQYSTDGGTSWTATLPTYNQTTAMTILTRCNCNSDTNQSSPTASVTTVPGVCTPVTATISGTATACDMVQLTASGGASYVWNGGASPSTAINTFSASGTYTVTVTGSNGCTASASQVVTVNANPTANITGPSSVCEGNTLTLTASGGASYSWSGPGGFAAATAAMSRTGMTAAMAGAYTVTVTNASGCTTSASRTVAVNALPAATAGSNSPVCTGATINLTASGGVTYAWSGPGFSSSLQNPSRGSATLAMAGTYTVTVTGASGCTATASTTVAVNSCGAVLNVVSYSIGKENGTSNGSITLNVAGGTPCTGNTYNYAWSGPSSGSATGGSSFVISPLATGWYIITITDCVGNSKVVSYFVPLATRGRTKSEGIPFDGLTAYPNPTSDLSTIKFTSWSNERMYLGVYSMDGREVAVLFDGIAEEEADYELPLSVSDLAAGVYNVLLASQSGRQETLRLVISK